MDESSMQLDYEEDSTLELDGSSISNKPMDNLKISIDNEIDPDLTVTFLKLEADKDKELDDSPEEGPQVKLATWYINRLMNTCVHLMLTFHLQMSM